MRKHLQNEETLWLVSDITVFFLNIKLNQGEGIFRHLFRAVK